ncbi:MAG TPA: AAA family ATPase [Magnetospirillaceae bacterium]
MRKIAGYILGQALQDEGDFVLWRARDHEGKSVLIRALRSERPSDEHTRQLDHEFNLQHDLDADWAVYPLKLDRAEGRTLLVLADPGGLPLLHQLGQPMAIDRFLRLAIATATALGRFHDRGLIHRDLKPANIIVGEELDAVRLTGFGIASPAPREHDAAGSRETMTGTYAYMAPEQTGRMNRSVDLRSDLYSLGITYYEMLTGALPFTATDPMEWVHCHVARVPPPPDERTTTVPAQLSGIVMKLLAKTAEQRYQTAAGVAADLQRCLDDWSASGDIATFALGTRDSPGRLMIPEKLYGREDEYSDLIAAFDRVATGGKPELILISGYSGIGKSSLVGELEAAIDQDRAQFLSGKFDQFRRDIPYVTLAQALQTIIRRILGQSEAEVALWRADIADRLGPNAQLIVDLIPELEFIIGKQPAAADLAPNEARNRFHTTFRRFLGAFAQPERPLVLFLDDL